MDKIIWISTGEDIKSKYPTVQSYILTKDKTIDSIYQDHKLDYNYAHIQEVNLSILQGMKHSLRYIDYINCDLTEEIHKHLARYGFHQVEGDRFYVKSVWNHIFKDIYYINLDRRTDRKEYMESQMKELGFYAQRYSAIDGKSIDIQKAIDDGIVPPFPTLTMGALGCSMSHFYIYKEIMRGNYNPTDWFLIMEDDVKFHPIMMLRSQVLQIYWDTLHQPQDLSNLVQVCCQMSGLLMLIC